MNAVERVVSQLNARPVRKNEFRAQCPVHQGRSRNSLAITDAGDRVLLHCFSGCDVQDILSALGMSTAELFDQDVNPSEVQRQDRIRRGRERVESFCKVRLQHVCEQLRENDKLIEFTTRILAQLESGDAARSVQVEEQLWEILKNCYARRTDHELEFEILNGRELRPKIELYQRTVSHAG